MNGTPATAEATASKPVRPLPLPRLLAGGGELSARVAVGADLVERISARVERAGVPARRERPLGEGEAALVVARLACAEALQLQRAGARDVRPASAPGAAPGGGAARAAVGAAGAAVVARRSRGGRRGRRGGGGGRGGRGRRPGGRARGGRRRR